MKGIPLFLSLLLSSTASPAGSGFRVNGQPVEVEKLPGARARFGDLLLQLEEQSDYQLQTDPKEEGRLYLVGGDGKRRLIGVWISTRYEEADPFQSEEPKETMVPRVVNPLASLPAEEIRGLWGVTIDAWEEGLEAKLALLDPARSCITLSERVSPGRDAVLPALPSSTRCLAIQPGSSDGFSDMSALGKLEQLRYFSLGWGGPPLDLALLERNRSLSCLDLSHHRLRAVERLGGFGGLEHLRLDGCEGVTDLAFAGGLKNLRTLSIRETQIRDCSMLATLSALETLDVSGSQVRDLAPLAGASSLREIRANQAGVTRLPAGPMPTLVRVTALSSSIPGKTLAAFSARNPQCQVVTRWTQALQLAAGQAGKLRVRSGGLCHRRPQQEKTLFETKQPDEIAEFFRAIEIDEKGSGFHCMCCGEPSVELYRGDELLAAVGIHHGESLRWKDGSWPGDAKLSRKSASLLIAWLSKRNVKGPLSQTEAKKAEEARMRVQVARATRGLPASLRKALRPDGDFGKALRKAVPDPSRQVEILLAILGTSNGDWSMFEWIETTAHDLLTGYKPDVLAAAVLKALRGEDRRARRGAARFWTAWRSPLQDWQPPDRAALRGIVLSVLQEARYYPLRQKAITWLRSWAGEMDAAERGQRLDRALKDPHPSVRRSAMVASGEVQFAPAIPLLLARLRGDPVETLPLPQVPAEEEEVEAGFDQVANGRPEPEVAALALGYLRHEAALPEIQARASSSPLYQVALALLGKTEYLRPEHFRMDEANQEAQLAAVEAVVRCQGSSNLKSAIRYRTSTSAGEDELVLDRLRSMLVAAGAPGQEQLAVCKTLYDLARWYAKNGEAYLKQLPSRREKPYNQK